MGVYTPPPDHSDETFYGTVLLVVLVLIVASCTGCGFSDDVPDPRYAVAELVVEELPPRANPGLPLRLELQTPLGRSYWFTETTAAAVPPLTYAPRCGTDTNACAAGRTLAVPEGTYLLIGSAAGTRLFTATISTPADTAALPLTQSFGGQNRWGSITWDAP